MTLFEDIQRRYEDLEAAQLLQLNLLAKAAGNMASGFPTYLGLTAPRWTDRNGKVGDSYVRLGEGASDKFQEKRWMLLGSIGGVVPFSLAVTIQSSDKSMQTTYVFEMSVKFCEDGYLFDLKDIVEPVVLSVEDVKQENFAPVYNLLLARLRTVLDPSKILIKT